MGGYFARLVEIILNNKELPNRLEADPTWSYHKAGQEKDTSCRRSLLHKLVLRCNGFSIIIKS